MYLDFYKLQVSPFQISTNPEFLWLGDKHREAMATLRYGILDNKGFLLLTGDVGTGKTTLINALLESLDENVMVVSIADPAMEQLDLFHYIANVFGVKEDFATKGEFLIVFSRFLNDAYQRGKKVVLIIDEAQRLSPELLEEIRLLSNIERPDTKLINIFFVGQNEFNALISREENRAIRQRITVSYEIPSLSLKETGDYLSHRLKVAGAERELFTVGAIKQIHALSRGYPRLINILADRALLTGFVHEIKEIGPKVIHDCAKELRIPMPEVAEFWRDPDTVGRTGATSFLRQIVAPFRARFSGNRPDFVDEEHSRTLGAQPLTGPLPQRQAGHGASVVPSVSPAPRAIGERRKLTVGEIPLGAELGAGAYVGPESAPPRSSGGSAWAFGLIAMLTMFGLVYTVQYLLPDNLFEMFGADTRIEFVSSGADSEPEENGGPASQPLPATTETTGVPAQPPAETAAVGAAASGPDGVYRQPWITTTGEPFTGASVGDENLLDRQLAVLFEKDSNALPAASVNLLSRLAVQLRTTPYERVVVRGYSDQIGQEAYNRQLADLRASVVMGYLRGQGVDPDTILVMGMGSYAMIAPSGTDEARQLNGRVEIEVIR